jgi:dTDP-4-amino-4,6-dideoxygalactose transaminase
VAEDLARRGINLPSSATLTREQVARVGAALRALASVNRGARVGVTPL